MVQHDAEHAQFPSLPYGTLRQSFTGTISITISNMENKVPPHLFESRNKPDIPDINTDLYIPDHSLHRKFSVIFASIL